MDLIKLRYFYTTAKLENMSLAAKRAIDFATGVKQGDYKP